MNTARVLLQEEKTRFVDIQGHGCGSKSPAMDYKKATGKRIRSAMDQILGPRGKPMTQDELADRVPGLTKARVGNYIQGTRYPDPEMLLAMGKALEEPAAYLAGLVTDPDLVAILRIYERTDDRGRQMILSAAAQAGSLLPRQSPTVRSNDTSGFSGTEIRLDPKPKPKAQKKK